MSIINQLTIGSTSVGIEDTRVSTAQELPSHSSQGDILLVPQAEITEPIGETTTYTGTGPNRTGPSGGSSYYSAKVTATVTTGLSSYSIVVSGDCWFNGQAGWGGSTATIYCSDTSILSSTSITDGNSYPIGGGTYGWATAGHGSGSSSTLTVSRGTSDRTITFYCSQSIAGYTASVASVQVVIPKVPENYSPPYNTSNGWTWWKRPDGFTECIRYVSFSKSVSSWSSAYYLSGDILTTAQRTYPITFKTKPVVTFGMQTYNNNSGWNWWPSSGGSASAGTTTMCPQVHACRVKSATVGGYLYIHAIGEEA